MTQKQFIEKAIEGGWKKYWYFSHCNRDEVAFGDTRNASENNPCYYLDIHKVILDPLAWQAVGKVEGWDSHEYGICSITRKKCERNPVFLADCLCHREPTVSWHSEMHCMIDSLVEGKSIEQFLETL